VASAELAKSAYWSRDGCLVHKVLPALTWQFGKQAQEWRENTMVTPASRSAPLGLRLIALFYMFGAVMLLAGLAMDPGRVGEMTAAAHGLSTIVGAGVVPVIAALALVMAYGLYTGARWGFFLAVAYLLYLAVVSLAMGGLSLGRTGTPANPLFFGNFVWSVLVLVYLLVIRGYFWRSH
jgi:hypothetical protein